MSPVRRQRIRPSTCKARDYKEEAKKKQNMITRLTGKVALITGATAGIGKACARALAKDGARLVLTGRRQDRLEGLKQEAEKYGTQAISVSGDAREESTAAKTVEAAIQAFGQIDILVNNAGAGNYKNLIETRGKDRIRYRPGTHRRRRQ
jgi:NADP-dependent 3-hydroxy acid dehydrogenase YdfG